MNVAKPTMNNRKNNLLAIIVAAGSLVICLGIAEGALRIKNLSMQNYDIEMWRYSKELKRRSDDPLIGHEHVRGRATILQSVQIRTNAYGLRGPEIVPLLFVTDPTRFEPP